MDNPFIWTEAQRQAVAPLEEGRSKLRQQRQRTLEARRRRDQAVQAERDRTPDAFKVMEAITAQVPAPGPAPGGRASARKKPSNPLERVIDLSGDALDMAKGAAGVALTPLSKVVQSEIGKGTLWALGLPSRTVATAIDFAADALTGSRVETPESYLSQIKDLNFGWGEVVEEIAPDLPMPAKITIGVIGEIFGDPLTYVSGGTSNALKGGARATSKQIVRALAEHGEWDDAARIAREGLSKLTREELDDISAKVGFKVQPGAYFQVPGTGALGRRITKAKAPQKVYIPGSAPLFNTLDSTSVELRKLWFSPAMEKFAAVFSRDPQVVRNLLSGDVEKFRAAFTLVDARNTADAVGKKFGGDYMRATEVHLRNILKARDVDLDTVGRALRGDADAVAKVTAEAGESFEALRKMIDEAPDKAAVAARVGSSALWPSGSVENYFPRVLTNEARTKMLTAKKRNPAAFRRFTLDPFELRRLKPGDSFLGVELAPPSAVGKSVEQQMNDIFREVIDPKHQGDIFDTNASRVLARHFSDMGVRVGEQHVLNYLVDRGVALPASIATYRGWARKIARLGSAEERLGELMTLREALEGELAAAKRAAGKDLAAKRTIKQLTRLATELDDSIENILRAGLDEHQSLNVLKTEIDAAVRDLFDIEEQLRAARDVYAQRIKKLPAKNSKLFLRQYGIEKEAYVGGWEEFLAKVAASGDPDTLKRVENMRRFIEIVGPDVVADMHFALSKLDPSELGFEGMFSFASDTLVLTTGATGVDRIFMHELFHSMANRLPDDVLADLHSHLGDLRRNFITKRAPNATADEIERVVTLYSWGEIGDTYLRPSVIEHLGFDPGRMTDELLVNKPRKALHDKTYLASNQQAKDMFRRVLNYTDEEPDDILLVYGYENYHLTDLDELWAEMGAGRAIADVSPTWPPKTSTFLETEKLWKSTIEAALRFIGPDNAIDTSWRKLAARELPEIAGSRSQAEWLADRYYRNLIENGPKFARSKAERKIIELARSPRRIRALEEAYAGAVLAGEDDIAKHWLKELRRVDKDNPLVRLPSGASRDIIAAADAQMEEYGEELAERFRAVFGDKLGRPATDDEVLTAQQIIEDFTATIPNPGDDANLIAVREFEKRHRRAVYLEGTTAERIARYKGEIPQELLDNPDIIARALSEGWRDFAVGASAPDWVVEVLEDVQKVIQPEALNRFVQFWDKVHGWIKAQMVASPGFHARNTFGAVFNNWLAGVDLETTRKWIRGYALWRDSIADMARGKLASARWIDDPDEFIALYTRHGFSRKEAEAFWRINVMGGLNSGQVIRELPTDETLVTRGIVYRVLGRDPIARGRTWSLAPHQQNFFWFRLNRAAANDVENIARGSLAFHRLLNGASWEEALDDVYKYHFNYDDLSRVERGVIRRVVPFYTWTRKILPLTIEQFVSSPEKMLRYWKLKREIERQSEEPPVVPQWFIDRMLIRTPFKSGNDPIYVGLDLPFFTAMEFFDQGPIEWSLNSLTPPIKTLLEVNRGKTFFGDIPLRNTWRHSAPFWATRPGVAEPLEAAGLIRRGDDGTWRMKEGTQKVFEGIAPILGTWNRLIPTDDRTKANRVPIVLSWFAGVTYRPLTERSVGGEMLRRQQAEDARLQERRDLARMAD